MVKNLMHNDSLQLFSEKLFGNVLSIENLISKKKAIKIYDNKNYGYFFEKGKDTFFLEDLPEQDKSVLDILPIVIKTKVETDYNKNVFYNITSYNSVKIPIEKRMPFKETIDNISNFKHTKPNHWLLYKIMTVVGAIDRVNYRAIAKRGFGKDCVVNNVRDLIGSVSNIYGATFAKLEYSLKHKFLILNEMGNLKADDKYNMQQFLLATGAFFNKYTKKSRATEDTLEEYDISKTSLGILYNPPMDYIEKGQEFFDIMFTKAVANRFIPFYFDGLLDEKFDAEFDVEKIVTENMDIYKNMISTLLYFKNNTIKNKYDIPDDVAFTEKTRRYERTFLKICDYISEYSTDEKQYYELVYELYDCYKKYDSILKDSLTRLR